jgi:hypothetical protein
VKYTLKKDVENPCLYSNNNIVTIFNIDGGKSN